MRLKTLHVRFFKSFNYDYLRKFHQKAQHDEWEEFEAMWYPHVRVPIDGRVTAIVGANESGKSHLLSAIEKGISGKDIAPEDFLSVLTFLFCRAGQTSLPAVWLRVDRPFAART